MERIVHDAPPAHGTNDPVGDRPIEAERVSDRPHHLAHLGGVAVSPVGLRQILGVDPQNSQIGGGVGAHEIGLEAAAIGQCDVDLIALGDDVVVGEDHAVGFHDHARAHRFVSHPNARLSTKRSDLVGKRMHPLFRRHVHHRRADHPRKRREQFPHRFEFSSGRRVADRRQFGPRLRILDPAGQRRPDDQPHERHESRKQQQRPPVGCTSRVVELTGLLAEFLPGLDVRTHEGAIRGSSFRRTRSTAVFAARDNASVGPPPSICSTCSTRCPSERAIVSTPRPSGPGRAAPTARPRVAPHSARARSARLFMLSADSCSTCTTAAAGSTMPPR